MRAPGEKIKIREIKVINTLTKKKKCFSYSFIELLFRTYL